MHVAALLIVAGFCFASLLAGAPYLETSLPGGLPVGNMLAWLGLVGAAGAAYLIACRGSPTRAAAGAVLVASMAWLPASVILSGNLALNFSGARGAVWLTVSLILFAAVLLVLVLASASAVVSWRRGRVSRTRSP